MKKSSEKNKKTRSLLFRNKKVVSSKKKLKSLKDKKKVLKKKINKTVEMYNSTVSNIASTNYENFPIETIDDIVRYKRGNKDDFKLPMMVMRDDLKKKYIAAFEELEKLNKKLEMAEIDILLAKTKCVEKKIE